MNDEINTEQPLMLQPQCVDCRFYDGFGACTEHGYQLRDNCKDFVGMETIHKYVEDMDNNEQKHPILQEIYEYLKNTPKEQIDKDWSDILKDTDSEAYFEKKYNAALERARVYHTGGSICDAHMTEVIFPELKESEDERNIKDLIDELKCSLRAANCQNEACNGGHKKRIALLKWGIAWLEKQGFNKEQTNLKTRVELGQSKVTKTSNQELEPKFKAGDEVYNRCDKSLGHVVIESVDDTTYFGIRTFPYGATTNFDITDQDQWGIVRSCENCKCGHYFRKSHPAVLCYLHKDCRGDAPIVISDDDFVETAMTCKEFEWEN